MRTSLILFFVVLSSSLCTSRNQINNKEMNELEKRLYRHVEFLTEVQPARNYSNLSSLNKVADYIHTSFSKLNCKVEIQKFQVQNKEYKNIIASFGPEDAPRIIVGAHYDVAGDGPGADDNASAV